MRYYSLDRRNLFRRSKWFVVGLLIFITTLMVATQYYDQPVTIIDHNNDHPFIGGYDEVLRRWYNFSVQQKWYNKKKTFMFDKELLKEIRDGWIINNSKLSFSYDLEKPEVLNPSMGQAQAIMDIFKNKMNGFFIECGGYDGETRSNTLVLERFFSWSGILIEADPINFAKMLKKNRRAQMSPTCLSIKSHPMNVYFLIADNIGRIHEPNKTQTQKSSNRMDVAYQGQHIRVQCFPLASYVAALGVKTVDYLSLDVEGNEMEVLETIPFDRVDIRALSVEYIHGTKSREYMIDYMEKQGYYVYGFVEHPNNLANDVIFVKK